MVSSRVRHVILDRDGVLNVEAPAHGYITTPAAWQWVPGSLRALALFAGADIRVSVATNQSAVGRGLMTVQDLAAVHARMQREAEAAGGRIDAVFACPHAPDCGCDCRKPAPGLINAALAATSVLATQTVLIGDDTRDLAAAAAAGVAGALVLTGKGIAASALASATTVIYADLYAAAWALVAKPAGT